MDLRVARVGEERAFFVSAIGGGDVAAARVSRKIKNISVSAGREHNGIGRVRFDFSGDQTARDDSFGVPIDQNEVEHFSLRKHLDGSGGDLSAKRLVGAEKKLLPGLAARVKGAGNLGATEGTVCEQATVFAGKRHALLDALIDNQVTDFGEPIDIRFARPEIAAFDRVVKQTENAVAIVLIIFGGVDAALRRDAVRAARAVLVTETFHVVAQFAQGRRRGSAGEAASHHDDLKFPAVVRSDQTRVVLVLGPLLRERPRWNFGIQAPDHSCCAGFTQWRSTATGIAL